MQGHVQSAVSIAKYTPSGRCKKLVDLLSLLSDTEDLKCTAVNKSHIFREASKVCTVMIVYKLGSTAVTKLSMFEDFMSYCATLWSFYNFTVTFTMKISKVIQCDGLFPDIYKYTGMLRNCFVCVMLFVKYLVVIMHLQNGHYIVYL